MIRKSVLEWQSLQYGQGDNEIPKWAAERLSAVAKKSPLGGSGGARILALGRDSLKAGQVVGVVAAEGCNLEILPKIDFPSGIEAASRRGLIRRRLIHLLAVALDIEIDAGSITPLGWQKDSVLEILIRLFSTKLADAVRQGMPRRYLHRQEDLRSLRGRLDVGRQFSALALNPSRLACRFDDLSTDTALNQIMKATIDRLSSLAKATENQRRLAELAFSYADVSTIPISELKWEDVQIDRTNARWKDLVSLARLLLGDRFQSTSSGGEAGFSLLFEMNTLFEQYVGRMLRRALAGSDLTVHLQGGRLFCLESFDSGRGLFQTKPDVLIKRGGEVVQIIDTKWKMISARIDDPKQGISQSDVYQMMAYGQIYRPNSLVLLFPHHAGLSDPPGVFGDFKIPRSPMHLLASTLDISESHGVKDNLRKLVEGGLVLPEA